MTASIEAKTCSETNSNNNNNLSNDSKVSVEVLQDSTYAWLQFVDNTSENANLNNTNIEDIGFSPFKFTLANDSLSSNVRIYSQPELVEIIKQYKIRYKCAICKTCALHFSNFIDREIHTNQGLCHPIFNINLYKLPAENELKELQVFIHFSRQRLETDGLKELLTKKLKSQNIEFNASCLDAHGICFSFPVLCVEGVMRYLFFAETSNYNLEKWYEPLVTANKNYTPLSKCIAMTDLDLSALQTLYLTQGGHLNRETNRILSSLERRVDREILSFTKELESDDTFDKSVFAVGEYFVKLSTRSPKDGTGISLKTHPNVTSAQRIVLRTQKMKITSASEAIDLISHSFRIFQDISAYLQSKIAFAHPLNIIIRSFFKRLDPKFEFRCFVRNKHLTCISQYMCYDIFPELHNVQLLDNIRQSIMLFHEQTRDIMPYFDYVLDVFVDLGIGNDSMIKVYVIEINSFAFSSSGSALFEWIKDYDILYGKLDDEQSVARVPIMRIAKSSISSLAK